MRDTPCPYGGRAWPVSTSGLGSWCTGAAAGGCTAAGLSAPEYTPPWPHRGGGGGLSVRSSCGATCRIAESAGRLALPGVLLSEVCAELLQAPIVQAARMAAVHVQNLADFFEGPAVFAEHYNRQLPPAAAVTIHPTLEQLVHKRRAIGGKVGPGFVGIHYRHGTGGLIGATGLGNIEGAGTPLQWFDAGPPRTCGPAFYVWPPVLCNPKRAAHVPGCGGTPD